VPDFVAVSYWLDLFDAPRVVTDTPIRRSQLLNVAFSGGKHAAKIPTYISVKPKIAYEIWNQVGSVLDARGLIRASLTRAAVLANNPKPIRMATAIFWANGSLSCTMKVSGRRENIRSDTRKTAEITVSAITRRTPLNKTYCC
jgi:hypothetical protein